MCRRSPDTFAAAREERLKVSGNPSQYDDLSIFIKEQEFIESLVARSILPTLILDVSVQDIPALSNTVADWMEERGGLYSQ